MASRRIAGTKRVVSRSASTGRFVSKAAASRDLRIAVVRSKGNGGVSSRSAATNSHVTGATSAGYSSTTVTEVKDLVDVAIPSDKSFQTPRAAGVKGRSAPADDPLAPARTRWLADVVGGSGRLAAMLGVSPSQTSRWSSGQERPGATVAPLLIDFEHVLARVRLVWSDPAAGVWMSSANAYLDGARPIDVLQLSGAGPVLQALDAQAWGGAA